MEFSFEVDPEVDIALGIESVYSDDGAEFEEGVEEFDICGYDPLTPTEAKPGSEDKVKMLAARYSAGVPLWHNSDCYDHGPDLQNDLVDSDVSGVDELDELEIEEA
ncbi:hypothetical protein KOR42_26910 [Thalassoglobus neptunius]|uniref:Uncharacterized protein n=1 Tax=Thalassoglobus neptunius TaxID=1938619 RepID=A0A5C5WX83_9PLAN|nr:hypothetical protein [Thalassoglobus neptunius]TWT55564.1 hypothetical protein KOR42_26910 [Thalassoglobus neptunius]